MRRALLILASCAALSQWADGGPKAVEILHVQPQLAFAPRDISFEIRVRPIATDREERILLCDLELEDHCTADSAASQSVREIEGTQTARLWTPVPFRRVGAGAWVIVATIGERDRIRAYDVAKVTLLP